MKKYLFMAVAAIAALSSCSSDNEVFNSEAKKALTFTATMEGIGGDTRTTFNATDKCAEWEVGDEIMVVAEKWGEEEPAFGTYTAQSAGPTTTFKASDPSQEVCGDADFYLAVFLGFMEMDEEGTVIPAKITANHDKFNMPLYAASENTELNFQNQFSILKVSVASDVMESVKSIKISSSNKALSGIGTFYEVIEGKFAAHLDNDNDPTKTFTVEYTSAVATSSTGTEFYIPIMPSFKYNEETDEYDPDTYKDLKIELSADGTNFTQSMTTKKTGGVTIERNKIYNITFKDNTPTTGTAKATIGGKEVDVNWVQLWAGGPKFAEYNVGVTDGKAESFGGYYCWGGFVDNDPEMTYNTGSVNLTGEYDTATKLWGSNWRMPTKAELKSLISTTNCTNEFTTVGGVNGYKFTGKGDYASNSLFLPIDGNIGDYWTANPMPGSSESACQLHLDTEYKPSTSYSSYRYSTYSVRAVLNETK